MSSPIEPSSFDPALHLHSCEEFPSEHRSDIEAGILLQQERRDYNQANRVVIQRRAWTQEDIPWSDPDRSGGTPSKTPFRQFCQDNEPDIPSSPPLTAMPFMSSPVAYPATSSPAQEPLRKRKRSDVPRSPLKDVAVNEVSRTIGGFQAHDDSDDDDDDFHAAGLPLIKKSKPLTSAEHFSPAPKNHEPTMATKESEFQDTATATHKVDLVSDTENTDAASTSQAETSGPRQNRTLFSMVSSTGKRTYITDRVAWKPVSYERLVAAQSKDALPGHAQRSYYGIDIHKLIKEADLDAELKAAAQQEAAVQETQVLKSIESAHGRPSKKSNTLLWTEKYRARKFTDLLGDERTHRQVLRWLKSWDQIVFPGVQRSTLSKKSKFAQKQKDEEENQSHKKVLLMTGPPGLGKTTLAHVCAKQAGYEVHEINASDERSRDIVRGKIKDMVGTENVRGVSTTASDGQTKTRKAGRPVCVVVDEVDGVVAGSGGGGGDGGFIKALLDLIALDSKNASGTSSTATSTGRKKKGEKFRLMRPIVLICNDVYAPALRPLRQSSFAEIVHMRKPTLNAAVARMQSVFDREGIKADSDGVRRLCEATWGVGRRGDRARDGQAEGDIRSLLVVGEWTAHRLRATTRDPDVRLTRHWIETNVLADLSHGGGGARNLGRGGAKEVVERVFVEGAGFPSTPGSDDIQAKMVSGTGTGTVGVTEGIRRRAMMRLREMVDASGEHDRIITDCFASYPTVPYQDTTLLTKPAQAYDWLHFHDTISSAIHGSQEWELFPYLAQSTLAFHSLFATSAAQAAHYGTSRFSHDDTNEDDEQKKRSEFEGPNAAWHASETLKANAALTAELQSNLSIALGRMYKSPSSIATELTPYLLHILAPDVKPVIINTSTGGNDSMRSKNNTSTASVRKASEKEMVLRSANAMIACGVTFERARVEIGEDVESRSSGGWVYRMCPPLDGMGVFETLSLEGSKTGGSRYGVRSVLMGEYAKEKRRLEEESRRRRAGDVGGETLVDHDAAHKEKDEAVAEKKVTVKRDFFGRVLQEPMLGDPDSVVTKAAKSEVTGPSVWVTYHEGYSNAVRKPITIAELMRGL